MQGKGPNAVGFIYVAGTKQELAAKSNRLFYGDRKAAEWCPFVSKRQMIGALAPIIAGSQNFLTTTLTLDETIANRIETIEQDNSILVLIVDTWTLHLVSQYESWMAKFDRINSLHTSVIVVWNEDDLDSKQHEALLKGQIAQTFATQSTREEVFFRPTITNPADFETALTDSLIRLQDKIIQNKETRQVLANSPFRKKPEIANAH
jgi:FxsC-like protein